MSLMQQQVDVRLALSGVAGMVGPVAGHRSGSNAGLAITGNVHDEQTAR
jgi:hypothetical protein